MITVVGKEGCSACVELKEKLTKDNVEFVYEVFSEIEREPRQRYAKLIRDENNGHFPLVLDSEGKVLHLDEGGNLNA